MVLAIILLASLKWALRDIPLCASADEWTRRRGRCSSCPSFRPFSARDVCSCHLFCLILLMMSSVGRLQLIHDRLVSVHVSDRLLVRPYYHVPPNAHLGREHVIRGRERRHDRPVLGRLVLLHHALAAAPYLVVQERPDSVVVHQFLLWDVLLNFQFRPDSHPVGHDEGDVVRTVRSRQYHLRDEPAHADRLLDGSGAHVLAVLELVLLLEAAGDADPAGRVLPAEVAGVE
mmetsp:Transcript_41440/g.76536  ORF Transcript_41440/g.76536 Transcript_41440/m.76536 type:complete len:231 (+) Transcript_41440:94-786(+)